MLLRIRPDPMNTYNNNNNNNNKKQHQYTATTAGSSNRLRSSLFPLPESNATTTLELDEDDIFSTGFPSSPINSPERNNPPNFDTQKTASCRRFLDSSVGILAVLPDMNPNPVIMPKVSITFYSSAMMIPLKKKKDSKKVYHHQSAPVRVPVGRRGGGGDEEDEDGVMMPPHEIVARREASPMTTFSVLEGAGRTLKGRDLRRVRNAVFRTTGFED